MTIRELGSLEDAARSGAPPMLRPQKSGEIPQQSIRGALRWIVGAAATCAILVVVSVALIDRPIAPGCTSILATRGLAVQRVGLAIIASAGWRPGIRGRMALLCACRFSPPLR